MRDELERLLRDATLTTLALAIALGWSLFQVGHGVAQLVSGLLTVFPSDTELAYSVRFDPLTWQVGDRVISLNALLFGLVELAVTLVAALLVRRAGRSN